MFGQTDGQRLGNSYIGMSYFFSGCLLPNLSLLLLVKSTASLQPTESRSLYSCLIDSALSQTGGPGGPAKKAQYI